MRVGILGYGNLGRSLATELEKTDHELVGIFSRRKVIYEKHKILKREDIFNYKNQMDAILIATGSLTDVEADVMELLPHFNTVDSFDMHREISRHRERVENISKDSKRLSVVSSGWDPGLMSLARLYFSAFMPYAAVNSFWGEGVSQGHSEAIRRISGVRYAAQYTIPKPNARERAIAGERLSSAEAHKRVCYVVAVPGAEQRIEREIREMRGYFLGYETEIYFITESEFFERHTSLCHRGEVVASGDFLGCRQTAALALNLESNPLFTANILLATARAVCRLNREGATGALTLFDIPPKCFLLNEPSELL
jgi:diaminopimelate dehydrogenase